MSSPFTGEIRMFAGNFAPVGWALCQGQLMAIAENDALFTLLGTTYGGDGQTTFGLPDLRGRIPVHQGPGFVLGQLAGTESVTLNISQLPSHNHPAQATSAAGTQLSPANGVWASGVSSNPYSAANPPAASMSPSALAGTGGNQPHENLMPVLTINFIIALFGIFPSRN